ncbi:hypothetical protein D9M69_708300 [compost metagenome]
MARLNVQRLGHQTDDVGLADRLGAVDRQGLVFPGLIQKFLMNEDRAIDRFHGLENPRVGHPLAP